jgi:hypothetical protein
MLCGNQKLNITMNSMDIEKNLACKCGHLFVVWKPKIKYNNEYHGY